MSKLEAKKLISRYFSFYFLGKFNAKRKSINYASLISLLVLLVGLVSSLIFKENLIINFLFPFTYIGTIGSMLFNEKLKSNIKNGCDFKEKQIPQTQMLKKVTETARYNTFLTIASIYTGLIQVALSKDFVTGLIIAGLVVIAILSLNFDSSYKDLKKKENNLKMITTGSLVFITTLVLRKFGFTGILESKYIIMLVVMFSAFGFVKTNILLNELFKSKDCTNPSYIDPINNYENLAPEEEVKTQKETAINSSVKRNLEYTRKVQLRNKELKETSAKYFKEKEEKARLANYYGKKVNDDEPIGYYTDENTEDVVTNRFNAQSKR